MKSFIRLNNELKYFLVITPLVLAVQFLFPKFSRFHNCQFIFFWGLALVTSLVHTLVGEFWHPYAGGFISIPLLILVI